MHPFTALTIATLLTPLLATSLSPREGSKIIYACRTCPAIGDAKQTYDTCKNLAECQCNSDPSVTCELQSVPPTDTCSDHGPDGAFCECKEVGTGGGCKRAQRRDPNIKC